MNVQTAAPRTETAQPVSAPQSNVVPFKDAGAKLYPPALAKAIMAIRRKVKPVGKDGTVSFGNVNYRYPKSEDVIDEVLPLLAEQGLIITQSEVRQVLFENEKTLAITYAYTIMNELGDVWPERIERTGLACVRSDRGVVDDKAANKASTQSEKWFYIKFFGIRTSDAALMDNDAEVAGDVPPPDKPKPPKPGSDEAKALEQPRTITSQGHTAESWAAAFIALIERATPEEMKEWQSLNAKAIASIENYPETAAKVKVAIAARLPVGSEIAVRTERPKPPKPPAPAKQMPDPNKEAPAFIEWLTEKMGSFETYEEGETYFNETIQALDMPFEVQEDAMGVWTKFEARFEA